MEPSILVCQLCINLGLYASFNVLDLGFQCSQPHHGLSPCFLWNHNNLEVIPLWNWCTDCTRGRELDVPATSKVDVVLVCPPISIASVVLTGSGWFFYLDISASISAPCLVCQAIGLAISLISPKFEVFMASISLSILRSSCTSSAMQICIIIYGYTNREFSPPIAWSLISRARNSQRSNS